MVSWSHTQREHRLRLFEVTTEWEKYRIQNVGSKSIQEKIT